MLSWIRPEGFKSFAHDANQIDLRELTLLVGANASGKSNLLEAVRFFQGLAAGFTVLEIVQGVHRVGREIWPGLRGGAAELIHAGGNAMRLQAGFKIGRKKWTYGLELMRWGGHAVPGVAEEWFLDESSKRGILLEEMIDNQAIANAIDDKYERHGERVILDADNHRCVLLVPPLPSKIKELSPDSARVRNFLLTSQTIDLVQGRMREYSQPDARVLGAEGENLSAVLRNLVAQGRKQDLLDWLSEVCAPAIEDLDFIEVPTTGDLLFVLVEKGGTKITAQAASDGTLRFLGLIAALWSMPEGALICLEELERGLHPSRVDLLIEVVVQAVRSRKLQVLATTHSPQVLYALGQRAPDLLGSAVVLGRTEESTGSVARSLRDLPAFDDVLARRGIEYLFTSRWLDRAL